LQRGHLPWKDSQFTFIDLNDDVIFHKYTISIIVTFLKHVFWILDNLLHIAPIRLKLSAQMCSAKRNMWNNFGACRWTGCDVITVFVPKKFCNGYTPRKQSVCKSDWRFRTVVKSWWGVTGGTQFLTRKGRFFSDNLGEKVCKPCLSVWPN
jgi:hypothetical protein